MLYHVILPWLAGGPLTLRMSTKPAWLNGSFRTPQRAGTCYYRCVVELSRYLLMAAGITHETWKSISYWIRFMILEDALRDLNVCTALYDASDIPLIRIGARQTAMALLRVNATSVDREALRRLLTRIERRLAALPVPDSLQWAPTYLTSVAADAAYQELLLAHDGKRASGPSSSSKRVMAAAVGGVVSTDVTAYTPASVTLAIDDTEVDADADSDDDEDGAADSTGAPLDAAGMGLGLALQPDLLLRQGSCDVAGAQIGRAHV